MSVQTPVGSAKWRHFVESFKAARAAIYVPEYSDDNERSLNHRYYR
jgi:hypothetical protein